MADPHSTPTPETNALITGHKGTASLGELAGHYNALLDHARKLERERDAARAALAEARELLRAWVYEGHLQTFEDREIFRAIARDFLSRTETQDEGGSK